MIPADILPLANWYLTLPVGEPEKPRIVKQPELATFQLAPWFHAVDGKVVFRAHCGGVTTSGSSYPRSELREMKGTSNAKWSTTSGTHTMRILQAVTSAPIKKPQVVCGQVHGGDDDVCVFIYDGASKSIRWKKGDTLMGKLIENYQFGARFEAKFIAAGGKIRLFIDGVHKAYFSVSKSTCYFKAGCYTQSNISKGDHPDTFGEVVIERLEVTHS